MRIFNDDCSYLVARSSIGVSSCNACNASKWEMDNASNDLDTSSDVGKDVAVNGIELNNRVISAYTKICGYVSPHDDNMFWAIHDCADQRQHFTIRVKTPPHTANPPFPLRILIFTPLIFLDILPVE